MASNSDLLLRVRLELAEKILGPMKRIQAASGAAAGALKGTRDQLRELGNQQKAIDTMRRLQQGLSATGNQLRVAQAQLQSMRNAGNASQTQLDKAQAAVNRATEAWRKQSTALIDVRRRMTDMGIGQVAQAEARIKTETAAANAQLDRQVARLRTLNGLNARASAARGTMLHGAVTLGSGMLLASRLHAPLDQAQQFSREGQRIAALGFGDKVTQQSLQFAESMKVAGTSINDNAVLMRDALTVFADEHHAKMAAPLLARMKFANEAMFGEEQGGENERKFMDMMKVIEMRNGAKSPEAFRKQADMVQRVITATGGRVGATEWLDLIKTGGVAAKGIQDEAFYYTLEPLVQEMGGHRVGTAMMSAYQGVYQGKTTKRAANLMDDLGLIGDRSKLDYDKAGQIAHLSVGALKGSELFRTNQFAWMEQVLLPQLASKGISKESDVLNAIGGIFSNRTAAQLFATMFQQRAQIHKNMRLNEGADGIDRLYDKGVNTSQGQEIILAKTRDDLYLRMSQTILPLYVAALEKLSGALAAVTGWMQRNPAIAKALMIALVAVAALLVTLGGAGIAIGAVAFGFSKLGLALPVLTGGLRLVGTALAFVGRAALLNPIGLAITGIAIAALLIYRYWGPISTFFGPLWSGIVQMFSGAWQQIRTAVDGGIRGTAALILNWSPLGLFYQAFAGVLSWFGITLPAQFSGFGAMILRGLASGITNGLGTVKDAIFNAGTAAVNWFKEKLGIHSPSRVFAWAGEMLPAGIAEGIQRGTGLVTRSTVALAAAAAGAMPALAGSMPALAGTPLSIDQSRPVAAAGGRQPLVYQAAPIQITINAAAGQDPQTIARAVAAELDRRDRARGARGRSLLQDRD